VSEIDFARFHRAHEPRLFEGELPHDFQARVCCGGWSELNFLRTQKIRVSRRTPIASRQGRDQRTIKVKEILERPEGRTARGDTNGRRGLQPGVGPAFRRTKKTRGVTFRNVWGIAGNPPHHESSSDPRLSRRARRVGFFIPAF